MKIKVCGMTNLEQVHQLGDIGVEFAGFIFYHKSPRYVFKHGLTGPDVKKAKVKPYKVGVFVNASHEEVIKQVNDFGLDMVQLHGHESPYECRKLADYIHVIKAFRFGENDHVQWMLKDYYQKKKIKQYMAAPEESLIGIA
jgi:phosphoribosylanthranilate isomerase